MAIEIRGAGEHNLQSIDLTLHDGITVVTGVSGSGKSSLVFDTLYHESRRRYLEAFGRLSAVANLPPAKVESISGLGPAVVVGQNLLNRNPNSTVATATGLHPLFRLLYSRFGIRQCPSCGAKLKLFTRDKVVSVIYDRSRREEVWLFLPLVTNLPGSHRALLSLLADSFAGEGLFVDGEVYSGPVRGGLDPNRPHTIEIQVGRFGPTSTYPQIRAAVGEAAAGGADWLIVDGDRKRSQILSFSPVCSDCGRWFDDLEPKHFHTPCPECGGKEAVREPCSTCGGTGLWPDAAAATWAGMRFLGLLGMSVSEAYRLFTAGTETTARLETEISKRLSALHRVGLGYIALDRPVPSLSRGEAQRLRLSVSLSGRLEDLLHVLDEPTVGQHPHDVEHLLPAFRELPGPVVFVEHDRTAAAIADHAVDLGPGAGENGGFLTYTGSVEGLFASNTSTGRFFSHRERPGGRSPREESSGAIVFEGATARTLKNIDVAIPVASITTVAGISGSGKSTLIRDVIFETLKTGNPCGCRGCRVIGIEKRPVPILVDQSPIGINPRSNPATYTKLADSIRAVFSAATGLAPAFFSFNRKEGACPVCGGLGAVEVRMRYLPSTWLECSSCRGRRFTNEVIERRIDLGGRSLSIDAVFDSTVSEIISLLEKTENCGKAPMAGALRILRLLEEVGLGYIRIGQPSPSLSGGEAQRIKLVKFLSRKSLKGRVILLDEPSTGLHPADTTALITLLDRLTQAGATVVIIEHNTDIIAASDHVIDLGPGAGEKGGEIVFSGPPRLLKEDTVSLTGKALAAAESPAQTPGLPAKHSCGSEKTKRNEIQITGATVHNLKGIKVSIPKQTLTVVTGVSGSGKSSLVIDVLEAEAKRRFLESLSFYERQSVKEIGDSAVGEVTGLGVTHTMGSGNPRISPRADCGVLTGLTEVLAALFAVAGKRMCGECGSPMERVSEGFTCSGCGTARGADRPEYFMPSTYASACTECHGVGSTQQPEPAKLIVQPDKPLCGGAMHSPGFFPNGYLCKPFNGGYYFLQALAEKYEFDPKTTPWNEMSMDARNVFLYGCAEPLEVHYENRKGVKTTSLRRFPGFYGWIRDWDVGGTYTATVPCPVCDGSRLRKEYLLVRYAGLNIHEWRRLPLRHFAKKIQDGTTIGKTAPGVQASGTAASGAVISQSVATGLARAKFLEAVGLGYLHLDRPAASLSAGEAQRLRLAGLLGGNMSSLSVILDEPCRGMHPAEVEGLIGALKALRDQGNTVIVIEHELDLVRAADYLIELGPGPGRFGGRIEYAGPPGRIPAGTATGRWLEGKLSLSGEGQLDFLPTLWAEISGAAGNNLKEVTARFPRGCITGVCGVSGSGKSTLVIDTIGRALSPRKHTTSVSSEPLEPYPYSAMTGFPDRCSIVDQTKTGLINPADFLGVEKVFRKLYAESEQGAAAGFTEKDFSRRCEACRGRGFTRTDLAFLPAVQTPCDVCGGTGYRAEVLEVILRGLNLAELHGKTIEEILELWGDDERIAFRLEQAAAVGLGYLLLRQPGYALSGGEAQRLKIAKELAGKSVSETLYILDEPTVGLHMEDLSRLLTALRRLSEKGHTVIVVEHHSDLLAACDWLIELGPGGGPEGGSVIGSGLPEVFAAGKTPSASYLARALAVGTPGNEL